MVKNFDKFQRFKLQRPPWIRFYSSILNDHDLENLPEITQLHLFKIWLLASQLDNKLPMNEPWIRKKIGSSSEVDLKLLASRGWISFISGCNKKINLETIETKQVSSDTDSSVQIIQDRTETDAESKKPFGEFGRVFLLENEFQKLTDKFGEEKRDYWITQLDQSIESGTTKPEKVKSAYATILKWSDFRKEKNGSEPVSFLDEYIKKAEEEKLGKK